MDPLAYEMASRLPAGLDLTKPADVLMSLHAAGYPSRTCVELVHQVISIAIAERDASGDSYGATNAILDCVATAALFGGGTSLFFIANILDASVSSAMAATLPNEICESIGYLTNLFEIAALAAAGTISALWFLVWSITWRSQPERVKRRRPF